MNTLGLLRTKRELTGLLQPKGPRVLYIRKSKRVQAPEEKLEHVSLEKMHLNKRFERLPESLLKMVGEGLSLFQVSL